MPRLTSSGIALLLFALLFQNSYSGSSDTPPGSGPQAQLVLEKTYFPEQFPTPLRKDRWSGGMAQGTFYRLVVDSEERILATDPNLSIVQVLDLTEEMRWQITGDDRHPLVAPTYISVDDEDNIYVTDPHLPFVSVYRRNGQFLRWIGHGFLFLPTGLWVDKKNHTLYVADWARSQVLCFDLNGTWLRTIGSWGHLPGKLNQPFDIAIYDDTLVVLDVSNARFTLFDLSGNPRGVLPFPFDRLPVAFTVDPTGNLYYVDAISGGVLEMDLHGRELAGFGQRRFGEWIPRQERGTRFTSVALDPRGRIFVVRPPHEIEIWGRATSDVAGKDF